MSAAAVATAVPSSALPLKPVSRFADDLFRGLCFVMALAVLGLVVLVGWQLWVGAGNTLGKFGFGFLTKSVWDPVQDEYGALPFIFGTLVSSFLGLLIATPLAVATAIFLTELAPRWVRQPLVFLVEMLAAIPSVILGLWAIFVLLPLFPRHLFPFLKQTLGFLPFFQGPTYTSYSMLAAALVIAVMILPIITSVSREILRSVPDLQREAAYGLGATRWEVTKIAVLSYAKKGIFGAMILGLGRALGETMAVTMVIGNTPKIAASLFQPGYTLASVIANEFAEATTDDYRNALIGVGLVLFAVTVVVNLLARLLLKFGTARAGGEHKSDPQKNSGDVAPVAPLPAPPTAREPAPRLGQVSERLRRWRKGKSAGVAALCFACALIVITPLALVFGYLVIKGAGSLNWAFFTQLPAPVGEIGGGIVHAITGTFILIGLASLLGVPVGVLGAIYLTEYAGPRFASWVRFGADILNGVPSIVWGIVAYAILVLPGGSPFSVGHFSALAGAAALAFIMIPLILRTGEEVLLLVPDSYREAALALGIAKWKTSLHIVLRTASKGVLTGVLLAIARVSGETAPLLFTALGNSGWSHSLKEPMAALPLQIFTYAISPYDDWHRQAWAAALVLLLLVLGLNVSLRLLTRDRHTGKPETPMARAAAEAATTATTGGAAVMPVQA